MRSFRPPRGGSPSAALPALLRATNLLGLTLGSAFGRLRESGAAAARLFERAEESALLLRMTREAAGILGARWDKVPERQRPYYGPEQRFRILRIRSFLGLSQRETAAMFRVSVETIARWEMETTSADGDAPRPLVAPNPPVRRFADVVRMLVKTMELAGSGGNDLIARTLARAGWKLSARTVGGDGPEWDAAYAYFDQAWNGFVLPNLVFRAAHGPIDWNARPELKFFAQTLREELVAKPR